MIDRRTFLGVVVAGLAVTPLNAAVEQPGKISRIGWLDPNSEAAGPPVRFLQRLGELGWVEGQNFAFEPRWADNKLERLSDLAAELVELKVDVIVTNSTPAALAAKQATTVIPIVMSGSSSPVERGLVKSLARPGGNITGLTNNPGVGFHQKMLQLLKEAAPRITRVALLWGAGEDAVLAELRTAAPALGVGIVDAGARDSSQLPLALDAAIKAASDGMFVTASPLNDRHQERIIDFTLKHRLPSVSGDTDFVVAGGLMSYWTDWAEVRRQTATYVDKILRGATPGELPIQQPTKFELAMNFSTAQLLGLSIPGSLRSRVDRAIS